MTSSITNGLCFLRRFRSGRFSFDIALALNLKCQDSRDRDRKNPYFTCRRDQRTNRNPPNFIAVSLLHSEFVLRTMHMHKRHKLASIFLLELGSQPTPLHVTAVFDHDAKQIAENNKYSTSWGVVSSIQIKRTVCVCQPGYV